MRELTAAVIGCGAIAREHLTALAAFKNVSVAAVCDISAARAQATAERFRIKKWYADYEQLITAIRPDLIHITTPPSSHFPIARRCLNAGLNVLCEKPITVEYKQFQALKAIASNKSCFLMENQQFRFHSSIMRLKEYIKAGALGQVVDVQVSVALNVLAQGSPYTDRNAVHFTSELRGGVIADFLPHIAYLVYILIGDVIELRTIWLKHKPNSQVNADEFRAIARGEQATAHVSFSSNAQPSGFWIRVIGSKMHFEADLYEPPRVVVRRLRQTEPAVANVLNGFSESRDVLRGALAGFWRKLGGTSSYDGLSALIRRTYDALEIGGSQPIPLAEIDHVASIVDRFTAPECRI
jgi:predicted dehydrogenase